MREMREYELLSSDLSDRPSYDCIYAYPIKSVGNRVAHE